VGVVLQAVGMMMFLATCCICSTSFLWNPILSPSEAIELTQSSQSKMSTPGDSGRTGVMLTVVTMTMGGLALATFGLGLQSDRREAALWAVITNVAMTLLFIAAGVALWMGDSTWSVRIGHGAVLLISLILLGFTIAALREVRAAPPPADIDIIPQGTKIPYNFYHDDPPEVRLQKELDQRRAQLDHEQQELDQLKDDLTADD
jgi:hypothetical protein